MRKADLHLGIRDFRTTTAWVGALSLALIVALPHDSAASVAATQLFWTQSDGLGLHRSGINGGAAGLLFATPAAPVALQVHELRVYWSDESETGAQSVSRNGTGPASHFNVVPVRMRLGTDLAGEDCLYYTSWYEPGTLKRAKVNGEDIVIVPSNASAIALDLRMTDAGSVDPASRLYFGRDQIERSALDGSSRQILATAPTEYFVRDIEIDRDADRMYWLLTRGVTIGDFFDSEIWAAELDGSNATLLYQPTTEEVTDLALDPTDGTGTKVYFAANDGTQGLVRRIGRMTSTGAEVTTVLDTGTAAPLRLDIGFDNFLPALSPRGLAVLVGLLGAFGAFALTTGATVHATAFASLPRGRAAGEPMGVDGYFR